MKDLVLRNQLVNSRQILQELIAVLQNKNNEAIHNILAHQETLLLLQQLSQNLHYLRKVLHSCCALAGEEDEEIDYLHYHYFWQTTTMGGC